MMGHRPSTGFLACAMSCSTSMLSSEFLPQDASSELKIYLPSLCSTMDTVTALQCSPCLKLIPCMARLSGNIGYVAVGKKIEVPLLLASLLAMK